MHYFPGTIEWLTAIGIIIAVLWAEKRDKQIAAEAAAKNNDNPPLSPE